MTGMTETLLKVEQNQTCLQTLHLSLLVRRTVLGKWVFHLTIAMFFTFVVIGCEYAGTFSVSSI